MKNLRSWKAFMVEVVAMWRKEHGFTPSNLLKISPIMTILGIIGILATPEPLKTVSWYLLGVGGVVMLFSLCFVFPYRKWKDDTDRMNPVYKRFLATEKQRSEFIVIELYRGFVEKDEKGLHITKFQAKVCSWLFNPITITDIEGKLGVGINDLSTIDTNFTLSSVTKPKVDISGLEYGAEETNCVDIKLDCPTKGGIIPPEFLGQLLFAGIQWIRLKTREIGEIDITNMNGFIYLQMNEPILDTNETLKDSQGKNERT